MSWVEVPDGVKMPETTTYKRAVKRQRAKFDAYWKASSSGDIPDKLKRAHVIDDYHRESKRIARVNKFRAKRGLKPLAMPRKPSKSGTGHSGG